MFRTTRKKNSTNAKGVGQDGKRIRLLSTEENDSDSQASQVNLTRSRHQVSIAQRKFDKLQKTSKKKGSNADSSFKFGLSFSDFNPDLDFNQGNRVKSSVEGKKIGFGGNVNLNAAEDDGSKSSTLYDSESLKRMISEQKEMQLPRNQIEDPRIDQYYVPTCNNHALVNHNDNELQYTSATIKSSQESQNIVSEDYIPLNEKHQRLPIENKIPEFVHDSRHYHDSEEMILTGDDAILLHNKTNHASGNENDGGYDSDELQLKQFIESTNKVESRISRAQASNSESVGNMNINGKDVHNNEDDDEWEFEVTRRAGRISHASSERTSPPKRNNFEISKLRQKIQTSLDDLEMQQIDTNKTKSRREVDIEHIKEEIVKQDSELQQAGVALEFYQKWREQLVSWVGAVRDIHDKVELILVSYHQLQSDRVSLVRWEHWENDILSVLNQHKLIDRVVGRQPPDIIFQDAMATVDEFGRDVKSQYVLQREQRRQKLKRIIANRKERSKSSNVEYLSERIGVGTESDAFISDEENESFGERQLALQNALLVVTSDLEEEFNMLNNLVALFKEWHQTFPDEYKQCYAGLSLADLAAIFVQIELCNFFVMSNQSTIENIDANWILTMRDAYDTGIMDDAAVERLIARSVQPAIIDLLDKSGVNLASTKQTQSVAAFLVQVQNLLPTNSEVMLTICNKIVNYVKTQLEGYAIPLLVAETLVGRCDQVPDGDQKEELEDAIAAATVDQIHRISRTLINLIQYWTSFTKPVVESAFIETILHFVGAKFLVLLSSVRNLKQRYEVIDPNDIATNALRGLMSVLTTETDWLQRHDLMLLTAPIRAAAANL